MTGKVKKLIVSAALAGSLLSALWGAAGAANGTFSGDGTNLDSVLQV